MDTTIHLWNKPTTGTACGLETADNIVGWRSMAEVNCAACRNAYAAYGRVTGDTPKQYSVEMPSDDELVKFGASLNLIDNPDLFYERTKDGIEITVPSMKMQALAIKICKAAFDQYEERIAELRQEKADLETNLISTNKELLRMNRALESELAAEKEKTQKAYEKGVRDAVELLDKFGTHVHVAALMNAILSLIDKKGGK